MSYIPHCCEREREGVSEKKKIWGDCVDREREKKRKKLWMIVITWTD
jgi:hypothetical protein